MYPITSIKCNMYKETKKLYVSPINNKCPNCIAKVKDNTINDDVNNSQTVIDNDCLMGELNFSTFKLWFNEQVEKRIKEVVDDVVRTRILPINNDISDMKKELTNAQKELTEAKNKMTL